MSEVRRLLFAVRDEVHERFMLWRQHVDWRHDHDTVDYAAAEYLSVLWWSAFSASTNRLSDGSARRLLLRFWRHELKLIRRLICWWRGELQPGLVAALRYFSQPAESSELSDRIEAYRQLSQARVIRGKK